MVKKKVGGAREAGSAREDHGARAEVYLDRLPAEMREVAGALHSAMMRQGNEAAAKSGP